MKSLQENTSAITKLHWFHFWLYTNMIIFSIQPSISTKNFWFLIVCCHFLVSHMNFQSGKVGRGIKKVERPWSKSSDCEKLWHLVINITRWHNFTQKDPKLYYYILLMYSSETFISWFDSELTILAKNKFFTKMHSTFKIKIKQCEANYWELAEKEPKLDSG